MIEHCPIPNDIIKDLCFQLREMGVNGFLYGITSNVNRGQNHPFKKLEKRLPLVMAQARHAVFSDEKTRIINDTYLKIFARNDECFFERKVLGPNLWRQPDKNQPQLVKLLQENNINSRVAWFFPSKYHDSWVNFFMLHSSLSDHEMKEFLSVNSDRIQRILDVYSVFFASEYSHQLNPIDNLSCITETSKKVLQMAAEGVSSQYIAKELYLSERGVNYHIDRMKVLFGAKNRVQLISRAFQMGILNPMQPPL